MVARTLGILLLLTLPLGTSAAVYKCTSGGHVTYSDKPCAGATDVSSSVASGAQSGGNPEDRYPFLDPRTGDPQLIGQVMQRRAYYVHAGMDADQALDRAVADVRSPSYDAQTPAKSGTDNMQDFLRQRAADQDEAERKRQHWLHESARADYDRARNQRDEERREALSKCQHDEDVQALRTGRQPYYDRCAYLR
jgi:hypothetical protein